jgi:vacuolar-type H+-ATPase subunit H
MIDESRAAANKEADSVSADGQTTLAAIHKQGKKNRSPAVDLVLDAFLES